MEFVPAISTSLSAKIAARMADEKNQEQLTKSTPSAAQEAKNEGELTQQTDSTVGAVAETSAKEKEAIIFGETPEAASSDEETTESSSSDDEPPEMTSSDDESQDTTHVDAYGQTESYQLVGKPDDDKHAGTTNPSSSVLGKRRLIQQSASSSSKRRRPSLPKSFIRPKIQAVTSTDEHGRGRLYDVPLVLESPSLIPTAAGVSPFSGYQSGHWNDYYGRRYRGMFNEMLADVLIKLLKKMPLVSTNGGIPDGAITKGFLYGYTNGAVIVCACHGQFFHASEFVKHATGLEVEDPSGLINLEFLSTSQFDG